MKSYFKMWIVFGFISIAFHIFLIFSGLVPNLISRPLHLALILPWIFLYNQNTNLHLIINITIVLVGIFSCLYIAIFSNELMDQYGFIENKFQLVISLILIFIVLEAARRSVGWPLPTVSFLAILYGVFGNYVPGEFGHPGLPINSFFGTLTIAEGGLWGPFTGVSVSIVSIFVIFGSFLNSGEAGSGFMNIATAFAGRLKGGAAKVSVISSALFGSISGSASANVASTGMVTLPAMIKLNYPKRLAAAVEAVASSGGQIMPPLMGAGAFVMVELTSTPYVTIMAAALLPALLYFFTVWMGINAWNKREQLAALPSDAQPARRTLVVTVGFFVIPFAVLLWGMFGQNWTPEYAAAFATLAAALLLGWDSAGRVSAAKLGQRAAAALQGAGQQV